MDGYSRLRAIDGVKGLVEEEADGPGIVDPRRAVLVQGGVVPEEGEEVEDDEHEAAQGDQVRGHGHGEALDDHIGVEGLQDVLGRERVIDARVLVLFEVGQILFPHVNHDGRGGVDDAVDCAESVCE